MKLTSSISLSVLLTAPAVHAWGALGHETVAFVATNFVQPSTKQYFQTLLHNSTDLYLASVATWADSYRYTAAGKFSASFHFIDAEDEPPSSCGVRYLRDCGEAGCIVGAVRNYTERLLDVKLPEWQRVMATKFIVHFLGDIHQPLHDENVLRGGNGIKVLWEGKETNLHHVWDSSIPEKLIGGYSLADAQTWANTLTTAIMTGIYAPIAASWLEGMNVEDPVSSSLIWAEEANQYVCTTVLKDGVKGVNGTEVSGDYYEEAVPVVQIQIARGGYRLARWLDLIVESLTKERDHPELKRS